MKFLRNKINYRVFFKVITVIGLVSFIIHEITRYAGRAVDFWIIFIMITMGIFLNGLLTMVETEGGPDDPILQKKSEKKDQVPPQDGDV